MASFEPQLTIQYPVEKPLGTIWRHSGSILRSDTEQLLYTIDASGGQSGSPVYKSNNIAVGIHAKSYYFFGRSDHNRATRITEAKFDNISYWKGL